ncbi:DUF721 domain-containing protein [Rickettsiales endosymbiont of Peranema trichophorum]|uniref:DUF721 domain-containing protein n=1 Tax=Rickettsiales endosymbiont of Peranema trichophorum TaxID=2486577 RepID=UPI001023B3A8|nr:DUF721 domain-containing protein [Rickettsiales endosymbiont of Peranema trichophorum]RZI47805.1 DUF721 domain-containing protein [Rickettsiales endosymbiont of Peranema trichophorum]
MQKTYTVAGFKRLDVIVGNVTRPICEKNGLAVLYKIIGNWSDIVGTRLGSICYPVNMVFGKNGRGNTLKIAVENPGYAIELHTNERNILERIAMYMGFRAVNKVKVEIVLRSSSSNSTISDYNGGTANPSIPHQKDITQELAVALESVGDNELRKTLEDIAMML